MIFISYWWLALHTVVGLLCGVVIGFILADIEWKKVGNTVHQCDSCKQQFRSVSGLIAHQELVHQNEK